MHQLRSTDQQVMVRVNVISEKSTGRNRGFHKTWFNPRHPDWCNGL